jgi:putative membrane protein
MSDLIEKLFDPAARERIAEAVRVAERGTSGEIVPCVVEQSDDYEESLWLASLIGGGIALVAVAAVDIIVRPWGLFGLAPFALIVAGAAALAALAAALSPRLRVLLAGRRTVEERTRQAAMAAFIAEEIFTTRDRTGILLFLSIREHRVIVLGDVGINRLVETSAWDDVVRAVIAGIHAGRPVDALVDAIGRCGSILEKAGCVLAPGDVNELSDTLRVPRADAGPPLR